MPFFALTRVGLEIGNTDMSEKVQKMQMTGITERTNFGEDGNGVWMRAEVQKMKKRERISLEEDGKDGKKWKRLHERGSPRTEKMKMEKMKKMKSLDGRGTPELQNVGGKWKMQRINLWENGKNWKNKTNSGVSKCVSTFPFFFCPP